MTSTISAPGKRVLVRGLAVAVIFVSCAGVSTAAESSWRAGAARVKITPKHSMWMSGYGGRDHPSEGTLHDLWAKALCIEDPAGQRAVLVTLDLVGIDSKLWLAIRTGCHEQYGLEMDQLALCTSHTHTGPVVGDNLRSMYFYDESQQALVEQYTRELEVTVVDLVGAAIEAGVPSRITWGRGHASFAVNRRNNPAAEVPRLRSARTLAGPVDHDVPVLAVETESGELLAVVFGYACHATTLSFYKWSGDYTGFAQIALEESHPGTVALFFAGCGADQNPLPRRSVELAEEYGQRLAAAVDRVLDAPMRPVDGSLATTIRQVDIAFATLPSRGDLEVDSRSDDRFVASRARRLLAQIDAGTPLSPTYPYPVQTWRLGRELFLVTLGGEVVVDFSVRLKHELGEGSTWVAGYTNDVMAYIPSRRVLREGGYEGGGAMVYYGLPTVWAPTVEEDIVREVHAQVDSLK